MPLKNGYNLKPHFYLQHGWGFNPSCFKEWAAYLQSKNVIFLDRGYFGAPQRLDTKLGLGFNVVVTHSLGFHFLSEELLNSADIVIVLSGFACFHGVTAKDGIISRRHIKRMQSRIVSEPEKLILDFYRDCSWSGELPDFSSLNLEVLIHDLDLLDSVSFDNQDINACKNKFLIIHGEDDRIVSLNRARDLQSLLPDSKMVVVKGAGHGLPYTHTRACMSHINSFIEKYVQSR